MDGPGPTWRADGTRTGKAKLSRIIVRDGGAVVWGGGRATLRVAAPLIVEAPSMSTDRDLLFGILAVQNNFVSRDHLVEAMNAWALARHRPLGELLRERGA